MVSPRMRQVSQSRTPVILYTQDHVKIRDVSDPIKNHRFQSLPSQLFSPRRSGDRISCGGRFSAPGKTGPGANPASCTMGTGSVPGVKRPGRGVHHPPPSNAEVKQRTELYVLLLPLWAFMVCCRLNFTFPFCLRIQNKFWGRSRWSGRRIFSLGL
jgi:hypothetical protein